MGKTKRGRVSWAGPRSAGRVLAATLATAVALTGGASELEAQQDYRTYDQLTDEIRSIVGSSDAASVESIGQSRDGRDV